MRNILALMLLVLGGNPNPQIEDFEKVFRASNIQIERKEIEQLLLAIRGVDLLDLFENCRDLVSSNFSPKEITEFIEPKPKPEPEPNPEPFNSDHSDNESDENVDLFDIFN
ncbi:60S ACIDIC ribosomal protein P2-1 [Anaeramoeba ignava]|uniref:60S ACIDIC ribosomal protein P2-1 n=1 Tax=Anaeramoeba ignava TaxID=1746090 RepID=A0A9Q0LDK9_ANAIG|nr:60S ACIDIC ribosomal protein P2-1 [Anaeramoeba ignava]|eukprot:Anaeramoba_ignava/a361282_261.p1 GENE.a361282_261~~a361282_261.p1  ORF type:complete len:111 (-),score=38.83 a361282_261:76-408(-)